MKTYTNSTICVTITDEAEARYTVRAAIIAARQGTTVEQEKRALVLSDATETLRARHEQATYELFIPSERAFVSAAVRQVCPELADECNNRRGRTVYYERIAARNLTADDLLDAERSINEAAKLWDKINLEYLARVAWPAGIICVNRYA